MGILKPFLCTHCGIWQPSLDTKRRHVLQHRKKYFKTQQLGMLWRQLEQIGNRYIKVSSNIDAPVHRSQNHLGSHLMTHGIKRLYQCENCQKCFSKWTDMTRHTRTHTKEKPFQCEICQKCFSRRGNLNTHTHDNSH